METTGYSVDAYPEYSQNDSCPLLFTVVKEWDLAIVENEVVNFNLGEWIPVDSAIEASDTGLLRWDITNDVFNVFRSSFFVDAVVGPDATVTEREDIKMFIANRIKLLKPAVEDKKRGYPQSFPIGHTKFNFVVDNESEVGNIFLEALDLTPDSIKRVSSVLKKDFLIEPIEVRFEESNADIKDFFEVYSRLDDQTKDDYLNGGRKLDELKLLTELHAKNVAILDFAYEFVYSNEFPRGEDDENLIRFLPIIEEIERDSTFLNLDHLRRLIKRIFENDRVLEEIISSLDTYVLEHQRSLKTIQTTFWINHKLVSRSGLTIHVQAKIFANFRMTRSQTFVVLEAKIGRNDSVVKIEKNGRGIVKQSDVDFVMELFSSL